MSIILDHAKVVTEYSVIEDAAVVINHDGIIEGIVPSGVEPTPKSQYFNLEGYLVSPGFIDIHTHGGYGVTFGYGDLQIELQKYAARVAKSGVTGFLCSIAAEDSAKLIALISDYAGVLANQPDGGAICYGLHLEGPFMNPEKKGAFHAAWLRNPDMAEAKSMLEAGKGWIKQITIAPELPGADHIATFFTHNGVTVALGHSNADYETASNALDHDFSHITHTFNAQNAFSHRTPGVVGAILTSKKATAEVIADMVHIHPAAIQVLVKCLGNDRIITITDAMAAAGLQDGNYTLVGQDVIVKNSRALLADGTIAGSTSSMNQCTRNMINRVGVSLPDAVRMGSLHPARLIRQSDRTGSIKAGKEASLIVIDEELNVYLSVVKGKIVYKRI